MTQSGRCGSGSLLTLTAQLFLSSGQQSKYLLNRGANSLKFWWESSRIAIGECHGNMALGPLCYRPHNTFLNVIITERNSPIFRMIP